MHGDEEESSLSMAFISASTQSISTMSPNSSLVDLPTSIYTIEDTSVKSSIASFVTTRDCPTLSDVSFTNDGIYRDRESTWSPSYSPTAIVQRHARSQSLGI